MVWELHLTIPSPFLGPDADDNDATSIPPLSSLPNGGRSLLALSHLGYSPLRQWFISTTGNDTTCAVNNASLPCATFAHVDASIGGGGRGAVASGHLQRASTPTLVYGTSANPIISWLIPARPFRSESNTGAGYQHRLLLVHHRRRPADHQQRHGAGLWHCRGRRIPAEHQSARHHHPQRRSLQPGTIPSSSWTGSRITSSSSPLTRDSSDEHCMYFGTENIPGANVTIRHNLCTGQQRTGSTRTGGGPTW